MRAVTRIIILTALSLSLSPGRSEAAPVPAVKPKDIASFQAHDSCVERLAFSPDGQFLITTGFDQVRGMNETKIKRWNVAECKQLYTQVRRKARLDGKDPPNAKLSSSEHFVCLHTFERLREFPQHVSHVGYSPDAKSILFCGDDAKLHFCDVTTGGLTDTIEGVNLKHSDRLTYSPDKKSIIFGSHRLDLATKKIKPILEIPQNSEVEATVFDLNSKLLAALNVIAPPDDPPLLILYQADSGAPGQKVKRLATYSNHKKAIVRVVLHPNGKTVISASRDNIVHVWDWSTGKTLAEINTLPGDTRPKQWCCELALRQDGKVLALAYTWHNDSVDDPGAIQLNAIPSGKLLATLQTARPPREGEPGWRNEDVRNDLWKRNALVMCLAFSPDGKMLATGNLGGVVTIWQLPEHFSEK